MEMKFRKPTEIDAADIATWKYEGEYSFYDNDKTEAKLQWARNIHNEENVFVACNEENEMICNFSFRYDEDEGDYVFGIQMRPNLTGKGMGTDIVRAILDFGRDKYKYDRVGLLVAKFNKRAIRVYEKLEFVQFDEFLWNVNGEEKEFIAMRKCY